MYNVSAEGTFEKREIKKIVTTIFERVYQPYFKPQI
jgi:hypothetical protein